MTCTGIQMKIPESAHFHTFSRFAMIYRDLPMVFVVLSLMSNILVGGCKEHRGRLLRPKDKLYQVVYDKLICLIHLPAA